MHTIPPFEPATCGVCGDPQAGQFTQCLSYIREHTLQMTLSEKRTRYRKTLLSVSTRLKAALDISPVRVVYALRVSCLLALGSRCV